MELSIGIMTDQGPKVYQITKLKVSEVHNVDGDNCDCTEMRVTGSCVATSLMNSPVNGVCTVGDDDIIVVNTSMLEDDMIPSRTPAGAFVFVRRGTENFVLDPSIPNISLRELYLSMTGKVVPHGSETFLSIERIQKMLDKAFEDDTVIVTDCPVDYTFVDSPRSLNIDDGLVDAEAVAKVTSKRNTTYRDIEKPDEADFYVSDDDWQSLVYSMMNGKNVLLTGPSGCGKSELVWLVAEKLQMKFEAFNMGAMSEPRTSLIGATHFDDARGTWFNKSRFVRTVTQDNACVLLDELTRCERGAFNILLPLMDRQGYLALDESEDAQVVNKADNVCFIATANIGSEYTGTDELDQALLNRFSTVIDVSFPPEEAEVTILRNRTGCSKRDARRLVNIARDQRRLCQEGEFMTTISTRMLIEAADKVAAGFTLATACKFAIENHFSNEGGLDDSERIRIRQIIQKSDD